jgi:hypothetical protein
MDGRCVTSPASGASAIGNSSSTGMSRGDSVRSLPRVLPLSFMP